MFDWLHLGQPRRLSFVSALALCAGMGGQTAFAQSDAFSLGLESADRPEAVRFLRLYWREIIATGLIDVTLAQDGHGKEAGKRGRVSGFLQGTTTGGTEITAAIDTRDQELRDIFRHLDRRHPDTMLREIEDGDVWVTMGDDSQREDLAPTSGRIYLRAERDDDHVMWGDFRPQTELSNVVRTDRTLYGATATWNSKTQMPDGTAAVSAMGYAGQTDRLTQRDIFRGTGGSAYFLSRRGIESSTETLIVELRDPVSGRVVSNRRLTRGTDYRLDPLQGVVILTQPLQPFASAGGALGGSLPGELEVNLVVQYDYVPLGGTNTAGNLGGRVEGWLTPALRLGLSAAQEATGTADNLLIGADVLVQRSETTYLRADLAQSEGPGLISRPSLTGGLDLDPADPVAGRRGEPALGVHVEGRLDLAEVGQEGYLRAWYERREAGFWSPDHNAVEEQQAVGLEGEVATGLGRVSFGAETAREGTANERTKGRIGLERQLTETATLSVEVQHVERKSAATPNLAAQDGQRTDLAAKLAWQQNEHTRLWVFGQGTVSRKGTLRPDNRIGAGAEVALSEALQLSLEGSTGTQGEAGAANLAWTAGPDTVYRLGLRADPAQSALGLGSAASGEATRSVTLGAEHRLNERWTATGETVVMNGASESVVNSYGLSHAGQGLKTDLGILAGEGVESDGTRIQRRGLSVGVTGSTSEEAMSYKLRAEYRQDESNNPQRFDRIDSWLLTGSVTHRISDSARLFAEIDAVVSEKNDGSDKGRYIEARLGYAFRPVVDDRLNVILSYSWLEDTPSADQADVDGNTNGPGQRSHIVNAAVSYDVTDRLTLGVKYGLRHRELLSGPNTAPTTAHLGIARAEYRIVRQWDLLGELRALDSGSNRGTEFGGLVGIYREVSPNARLGVGYAKGGISDDLRTIEPEREGFFVNLIAKF